MLFSCTFAMVLLLFVVMFGSKMFSQVIQSMTGKSAFLVFPCVFELLPERSRLEGSPALIPHTIPELPVALTKSCREVSAGTSAVASVMTMTTFLHHAVIRQHLDQMSMPPLRPTPISLDLDIIS